MTSVVRAFSILGLALVVGLIHSWLVPISIAAEGNEQTAQERIDRMQGDSGNGDDPAGQVESTDPGDPANGSGNGEPRGGEPSADAVTDPKIHLSLSQFRMLYERHVKQMTGEVVLIDARGTEGVYEQAHIWGAEHITADIFLENLTIVYSGASMSAQDRMRMILRDQWVIIYCGGGDCDESENLRTLLVNSFGLENVWIFEAGYPAWEDAGLPTAQGSSPFGQ